MPSNFEQLTFNTRTANISNCVTALNNSGCILVKNLFNPKILNRAAQPSRDFFSTSDKHLARMWMVEKNINKPRLLLARALFNEQMARIILGYLGGKKAISSLLHNVIRMQDANDKYALPLHQDEIAGISDCPAVTLWVQLDPIRMENTTPRLELFPNKSHQMYEREDPSRPGGQSLEIQNKTQKKWEENKEGWQPVLNRGDALFFSSRCPHRTLMPTKNPSTRISTDFRFWKWSDESKKMAMSKDLAGWFELYRTKLVGPARLINQNLEKDSFVWKNKTIASKPFLRLL